MRVDPPFPTSPSEGLTLGVLRGADGAVALQGHRVVVEGGDVGLAARQAHGHVTHLAVGAHAVVAVDVGRVRHGFLKGTDTHGRITFGRAGRKSDNSGQEKKFDAFFFFF